MSTRHGAPGGLGRGLSALIRTNPRPEEAERSVAVLDPAAGADPSGGVILDSSVTPDGDRRTEPPSTPPSPEVERTEPTEALGVPESKFAELDVAAIRANPRQPRQVFDEDSLGELTHSIREFGVLQPVVVRPANSDGSYELVMGERRLRAAIAAGLTRIPAIVRDTADEAMLRDALLENLHRTGLNPLEEAAAYQQLLDDFGVTHEELALRIGRSRSQVSNTIRLMNLSIPVQRRVAAGVISAGHARALLALADRDAQDELAGRIVAEGLSVRATEEIVATAAREAARDGRPARRSATHRITAPGVHELADRLSDVLDTRVRVDLGRRKGKITVEFASVDDLERIVGVIAPELAVHRAAAPEHFNGSGSGPFGSAGIQPDGSPGSIHPNEP
jgi:ParB family transcriptional regulator, chromosome partitioning protein